MFKEALMTDLLDFIPQNTPYYTHVLMPCMGTYCTMTYDLDETRRRDTQGVDKPYVVFSSDWDRVDCPDCRAPGLDAIRAESARQQGRQAPGKE